MVVLILDELNFEYFHYLGTCGMGVSQIVIRQL